MQAPQIIDAQEEHSERLADILADSFSEDPVMNWVIPEPALYKDFFRLLIRDIFLPPAAPLTFRPALPSRAW
jgi:hypothetical protein